VGRAELSVHSPALPSALAIAPRAESSPAPENFFSKTPSVGKATLFGAETVFGQVFGTEAPVRRG
jgi:hypothetical protein